ncbi:hypothetical protein GCM10010982_37090 [Bowmanella pacifica]|uniref:DUF58 domain-containing protein n=2 Tax=Bowmanella pacifica TaxID=502051 RepID=A0A917Z3V4_9ALTE|nr:hypothetical protein GCM10010982_37090 [Bowmanella pacifica]
MIAGYIQRRMTAWLSKRIPPAQQISLNRGNIFIFPSRFGALYLGLCLALFVLGTNYQNNLILLLGFFLLALMLVSLFASYLNFSGLSLQLGKLSNSYADSPILFPVWLETQDTNKAGKVHFAWYGTKTINTVELDNLTNPISLNSTAVQRGKYSPPRLTLSCYYPLGLFRCWTHIAFNCQVIVYPAPMAKPWPVTTKQCEQQGEQATHQFSMGSGLDEFDTLTEYQPGQPLYHVAWKQAAKGQGLLSKRFATEVQQSGWLVLNCADKELEENLSRLCFSCIELDAKGWVFGLELPGTCISPGKGQAHLQACLTALALFKAN